ncbi:YfdX family protein [Oecophyllibacter saccharovorans]|uniref:YfdX family protein n=1 Tax=Oecophyllibacter saccharovorans TaxID=2558360 RepID=UPI001E3DDB17|nr:YfdX family protein [Oecophyllibacter saccharovorans]
MSLHASIRFAAVAALMGGMFSAVPAMADDTAPAAAPAHHSGFHPIRSLHRHWEKVKARHDFRHLSVDGQYALIDILEAQDFLNANKTDQAIKSLKKATDRLKAAGKADNKFMAAEAQLQVAPQHPLPSTHVPQQGQVTWIPVAGEFIVSDTLAPEKKAAIQKANALLKAGKTAEALQNVQIVSSDLDFILYLAPLAQTEGDVNRALVFAQNKNDKEASAALTEALNSLVAVSENFYTTELPAPGAPAAANTAAPAATAPASPAPAAAPAAQPAAQ